MEDEYKDMMVLFILVAALVILGTLLLTSN